MRKQKNYVLPFWLKSIIAGFISFIFESLMFLGASAFILKSESFSANRYPLISYAVFAPPLKVSVIVCSLLTMNRTKIKAALCCFISELCLLLLNFLTIAIINDLTLNIKSLLLIPICFVLSAVIVVIVKVKK